MKRNLLVLLVYLIIFAVFCGRNPTGNSGGPEVIGKIAYFSKSEKKIIVETLDREFIREINVKNENVFDIKWDWSGEKLATYELTSPLTREICVYFLDGEKRTYSGQGSFASNQGPLLWAWNNKYIYLGYNEEGVVFSNLNVETLEREIVLTEDKIEEYNYHRLCQTDITENYIYFYGTAPDEYNANAYAYDLQNGTIMKPFNIEKILGGYLLVSPFARYAAWENCPTNDGYHRIYSNIAVYDKETDEIKEFGPRDGFLYLITPKSTNHIDIFTALYYNHDTYSDYSIWIIDINYKNPLMKLTIPKDAISSTFYDVYIEHKTK